MERSRADSGEKRGPGRTSMATYRFGRSLLAQTPGRSVRHDPSEHLGCSRAVSLDDRPPGGEPVAGVAVTVPRTPAATTVTGIGGDAGGGSVARPTLPRDRAWPDEREGAAMTTYLRLLYPRLLPDLLHTNARGNVGQVLTHASQQKNVRGCSIAGVKALSRATPWTSPPRIRRVGKSSSITAQQTITFGLEPLAT